MRVCDTHEDVWMCADKLCNRKMCVRQVSVYKLVFGVNRIDLDLGSKLILSNNQRATL